MTLCLVDYGLATRIDRSAAVLHVEYQLTPTGTKLASVIELLHALQQEHAATHKGKTGRPAAARPRLA